MTLKPYAKYKDSGVEWLGKVPEHWEVKRLKFVATVNDDVLDELTDQNTEIEYVEISGVQLGKGIIDSSLVLFGNAPSRARRTVHNGDIIVSTVRTYLRAIARIKNPASNLVVSTGFAVLRPRKIDSNFLGYLFEAEFLISEVISRSVGISYPAINANDLMMIHIPIPNIQEQTAIATYLDQETARIDELIAQKTRFIELLKEKRSALITHAVTKGLNPNAKMKDSGVEWLGKVPEHWEVKRLKFVASYQNSNVDKKTYDDQKLVRLCNYTDVYYNEFISNSMDFMEATASDSEIKSFSLEQDNILITKDSEDPTDIGIPAIVAEPLFNVVCGYHLTIIRTIKENCASFIFRILQSHPTKAQFYVESPGITRFGLGQDTIGGLAFALPPIAEQTAIATYLDQETARIDELIQLTEKSISLIKERRSALITAAVTGKINVQEYNTQKEFV